MLLLVFLFVFVFVLVFFGDKFLCIALAVLKSLCSPGWPRTQRSAASAYQVLELKVCVTTAPPPLFFSYCKTYFAILIYFGAMKRSWPGSLAPAVCHMTSPTPPPNSLSQAGQQSSLVGKGHCAGAQVLGSHLTLPSQQRHTWHATFGDGKRSPLANSFP